LNAEPFLGYARQVKRKRTETIAVEARASTSLADVAVRPSKDSQRKKPGNWGKTSRQAEADQGESERFREPRERAERPAKKRKRPNALAMAVAMLARREHSQAELLKKLLLKEVPEDEAKAAIQRLADEGLQSDQRFLESRLRIKLSAAHGPNRAQFELSKHGLDEEAVSQAMEGADEKWQEAAYDLIERKYGRSPLPRELQTKAFNLLIRRGFTYNQAWAAIRDPRPDQTPA
jgi:regulatory protein